MDRLTGYRRENGRVGIRNYVAIIPVDDISNAAVEAVASIIKGVLPLPHPYGRLQFGADLDLFFRTLVGTGRNPNIASAVVIGIEPEWTQKVADGIRETGKVVESFSIERSGDLKTIERASRAAKELLQDASSLEREEISWEDLLVSIKCGESDTTSGLSANPTVGKAVEAMIEKGATVFFGETSEITGGEDLIAKRIKDERERARFWEIFNEYASFIEEQHTDLLGSQPTQGNIRGGLTTIEEKALGNIQKIGDCSVDGVLDYAEEPTGQGLYFMNTSSAAAECVTLFAAGGSVLHIFPTGQGNIIGNPVIPVIKLSGNPLTLSTMKEHMDVHVSSVLSQEMSLAEAGELLLQSVVDTVRGRLTSAEVLGHREFVLTKLFRSA